MNGQQKRKLLELALTNLKDDPNNMNKIYHLIRVSRFVLAPAEGLVWKTVIEVLEKVYDGTFDVERESKGLGSYEELFDQAMK